MRQVNAALCLLTVAVTVAVQAAARASGRCGYGDEPLPETTGLPVREVRAESETLVPVLENDTVVAGTKRLKVNGDGSLVLSECGECLFSYGGPILRTGLGGHYDWPTMVSAARAKRLTSARDGRAFVFAARVVAEGVEWEAFRERVELASNGLVRVTADWRLPPDTNVACSVSGVQFALPYGTAAGSAYAVNGTRGTLPPGVDKARTFAPGPDGLAADFFVSDAARGFVLRTAQGEATAGNLWAFPQKIVYNLCPVLSKDKRSARLVFTVDLRRGVSRRAGGEFRGDVDFRAIDDLGFETTGLNRLSNPSFEEGLKGMTHAFQKGFGERRRAMGRDQFAVDTNEHVHGDASLRIRTWLGCNGLATNAMTSGYLRLPVAVVEPGTYTLSFWAKGSQPAGQWVALYGVDYFDAPRGWRERCKQYRVTDAWQRFTRTFKVDVTEPVQVCFAGYFNERDRAACPGIENGHVWIDAVQLEKGTEATPFAPPPVATRLVTSSPEDFLQTGARIGARLEIRTDPNVRGEVRVRVKDFYGAWLFDTSYPFAADAAGHASVAPDFDGANLGRGLFVVRFDYALRDGRTMTAYDRLTVCDWLKNEHPRRSLFADDYGYFTCESPQAADVLERWKKVGFGTKCHIHSDKKADYDFYAAHGIGLSDAIAGMYRQGTGVGSNAETRHWRYLNGVYRERLWNYEPNPEEVLFWEPLRDPDCDNGRLTAKYLEKVRRSAEWLARTHPWIRRWMFAGELFSTQPPKTWGVATREEAYPVFAKVFKAWAEGMRAGSPDVKVTHDCPWNLNPGQGLEEVDRLLSALDAEGVRVDWIAAHTYRLRPEHPDIDADLTALRKVMAKHGYGDAELSLPEGMHWGSYNVSSWGLTLSSWGPQPQTWHSGPLSYDMGWWEKIAAAWRVRSWIVGLKHDVSAFCASGTLTFEMDYGRLTPYASQLSPNTLGNVLGHATRFLGDFRPAPDVRIYAFDDGFGRPVAAVWCCDPRVDDGRAPCYRLESDFGGSLETAIDFMNNPRAVRESGLWQYPATPFPVYLRGKRGAEEKFLAALKATKCVSGAAAGTVRARRQVLQVRRVDGRPDWTKVPSQALTGWGQVPVTGSVQLAWNDTGLFVRVTVADPQHVHAAFALGRQRNDNDTLQLGFDTLADALVQATDGCNQDDYEYAVFPDASASGAVTWANRVADCQMTGRFGQQGNCLIPEVPSSFARADGQSVYEVFVPADRLVPGKLAKGSRMGFGLTVTNAEDAKAAYGRRVAGGASLGPDASTRVGKPRAWTELVFR